MDNTKIAAEVLSIPAKDWLTETYLPFALYVIQNRALVDVSGVKPVVRRIMWSMYQNGVTPNSKHLKASRAASDTVAYHPHGSSSIEAAIAGMAQGFNLRVPLIDPSGSVGKVAGDHAAAARYWEARLTKAAMELLKEIPDGAVPMGKNYDGELDEPKILPVRWPVEVINGTQGIAVGYASKMAPHNPSEVMDACRKILKNPNMTVKQLMKIMPGPDMPSGGELLGVDAVEEYYTTGSGSFTIRGRYTVEQMTRGKVRIIFHELPYEVSAENVMTKIQVAQGAGQFKDIALVKDLSDKKNAMRLVIETKAGTNHLQVLNEVFKKTPAETKFPVNSTVLVNNNPVKAGILDLLKNFIEFRKVCTLAKANNRLGKIDARIHRLNGILAVLIDIDKAIAIIRKSDTVEIARTQLMKAFKIDEEQAEYILSMALRRLTKQDSLAIKKEMEDLKNEAKELKELLKSPEKLIEAIDKDLLETKKIIASDRRTIISGVTTEEIKEEQKAVAQAAKVADKNMPCYITRFANGTLLRSDTPFKYVFAGKKYVNSPIVEQIETMTQDLILVVGSDGIGRRIPASYLAPDVLSKPKDAGVILPPKVTLVGIAKSTPGPKEIGLAMATVKGKVKVSKMDLSKTGDEFTVFLLDDGDAVLDARWLHSDPKGTFFSMVSSNGNVLVFDAASIRAAGAKAGGVAGMKQKDANDRVISFGWIKDPANSLIISQSKQTIKVTPVNEIAPKGKGAQGMMLHGFKKGETSLTTAYAGTNVIAALDRLNNPVNLPPVTKRATKGADFALQVFLGSMEAEYE